MDTNAKTVYSYRQVFISILQGLKLHSCNNNELSLLDYNNLLEYCFISLLLLFYSLVTVKRKVLYNAIENMSLPVRYYQLFDCVSYCNLHEQYHCLT